jgi:hypothetical protein
MSSRTPSFVLPYEAEATKHREAEQRHRQVKAWLKERERQIDPPPPSPDRKPRREKEAA